MLDLVLAQVLEGGLDPVPDLFKNAAGDGNATGFGQRFDAGGDVDTFAVDVLAVVDDIAEIDSHRKSSGLSARLACIAIAQATASCTVRNSARNPSPVCLTMRPECLEISGSITSVRAACQAATVPSVSCSTRRV
jgi:hypothetical protein